MDLPSPIAVRLNNCDIFGLPMKSYSYHFILKGKSDYKDLAPVFPDILNIILQENDHFQSPDEEESREMFIELNMTDLLQNRKPEGYNRKGKYRLVFPMDRKEFYIRTTVGKPNDVKRIGDSIAGILTVAKIKFETAKNEDVDFE
jgi:hypothetical protein